MTEPVFVFLHGFLGRAETRVAGMTFEYFRGLRDVATDIGVRVEVPQMPGRTGVEARALAVRPLLQRLGDAPIILVGVSMGGLVARALATHYDPHQRIRAVATVCTPHRGSPIADRALAGQSRFPDLVVRFFSEAVDDLSIDREAMFNVDTPDREDVTYLSWAGVRPPSEMPFWFKSSEAVIREQEGPNDGLVSVSSATWGELVAVERADHFESIGWSILPADPKIGRPFDQKDLWRRIIRRTRDVL